MGSTSASARLGLFDGVAYMVTRPRTIGELWITPTDQA